MPSETGPRPDTRELDVTVASQRRRQIIEAARACITEEGVEKLTLRKVGERAKVSHATIAYYFKTRRELIDSALLEISDDFLDVLRQRNLHYGMQDLWDLVQRFLDAENSSSRFVVQMIDAGLHDVELRSTHDDFVHYGRDRIERSIRVAIEMGDLREDIDPVLAAALMHTVLIWWQSEIAGNAASPEFGREVGNLLLRLLGKPRQDGASYANGSGAPAVAGVANGRASAATMVTTPDIVEASLARDPRLTVEARRTLAETFRSLYEMAADLSGNKE